MSKESEIFLQSFLKKDLPEIRPGDTVRVHQKIKEKNKERIQAFEGEVLARKHGKEAGATITVRRATGGVGVEKIFPLHSPTIEKIEVLKRGKVRRAKLYYLREAKGKKARLKRKPTVLTQEAAETAPEEKPQQEPVEAKPQQPQPKE